MSFTILVVEKSGELKELTLKSLDENELYKKAGFKTPDGFKCHVQWNIENLNNENYSICVYGKTTGRANQENKYEFPPPIDNTLFFGNCLIVNKTSTTVASLSSNQWYSIYEHLYGGFEDIGTEDSEEEEKEDEDDDLPKTKSGYAKDGFVVDDDVDEDEEEEDDEDDTAEDDEEDEEETEEEEVILVKKKPAAIKTKTASKPTLKTKPTVDKKKRKATSSNVFSKMVESNYLDCESELSEESYVA